MTVTINGTTGITSPEVVLDNAAADGGQVVLKSSGYSDWNWDNYSGRLRAYYSATEYFTITNSGNVGIGTGSPAVTLDIQAASAVQRVTSTTGTNACYTRWTNTGGNAFFGLDNSAGGVLGGGAYGLVIQAPGALKFNTGGSSANQTTIDSSGNLLVGTTSAYARFVAIGPGTTSGTFSCAIYNAGIAKTLFATRDDGYAFLPSTYNNTLANAANLFINTDGSLSRSTSSLKYKQDVKDATHGLSELLTLRPVTYRGKGETDSNTVFGGLIAEEVHEAGLTEFVQYAEDGTPDALAYGNMVSLCIKAIQEQQAIITTLTARIEALEAKNA